MTGLTPTRLLGWVSVRPVGGIQVTHFAASDALFPQPSESGTPTASRSGMNVGRGGSLQPSVGLTSRAPMRSASDQRSEATWRT
jgi:hypothetical protein